MFDWSMREFFFLPKRSARRVVDQLAREYPMLDGQELRENLNALGANEAYRRTLYSREIAPRTFARFDRHPEFALLAAALSN
jgi:hypothetical protein